MTARYPLVLNGATIQELQSGDTLEGLGTIAQQDANNVNITGGTISGVTGIVSDVTATTPLSSTGGDTPNISIAQSNASTDGYLSSTDWTTFNNKGNVDGPISSTDNAITRFDSTTGQVIQNSLVTISDLGDVNGVLSQTFADGTTQAVAAGKLWYNATNGSWNMGMGGGNITQQVGEELFVYGKASANISDTYLQAIVKTGTVGASGAITFGPASAGITDPGVFIGVATDSILSGSFGRITSFGVVRGINTTGSNYGETWSNNDDIWYNQATGGLTNVKPSAPYQKTRIGTIINAGNGGSGSFQVHLEPGTNLGGTDSNVQLSTPTGGQILSYDSADNYWKNTSLTAGTGISISSASNGVVTVDVVDGVYTTGSYSNPSWITSLDHTKITGLGGAAVLNVGTTAGTVAAGDDSRITGAVQSTQVGAANGVASLGSDGLVPSSQLPAIAITDTFVVNSQSAMLALSAQVGDIAVRTDLNQSFILTATPASTLANWQELLTPPNSVTSVNGQTGAVSLNYSDVGAPSTSGTNATGTWNIGISGNAATATTASSVTDGVYTTGSYADPSWITSLDQTKVLPSQSGRAGKFLTTDGTYATWATVNALPSQTGQSGKYLTTDGTNASWAVLSIGTMGSQNANNVNITGGTIATTQLQAYSETCTVVGAVGSSTYNIDLSLSNIFDITLGNNVTFTFTNAPASGVAKNCTIILRQDSTGNRTATFTGAKYTDGTAPILSTGANQIDVLTFFTVNGGSFWFGTYAMANVS